MSQQLWDEFKKRWDEGPFYADELDALKWADLELTRLRELEHRAKDVEGLAKVNYEHMFPDQNGWEKETDERLKECYRSNAMAHSAWLTKGGE